MSFAKIIEEIRKLSFAKRQELIRIAMDNTELTSEENAILDGRMEDFSQNPEAGIPLEEVKDRILKHLADR